MIAVFVRHKDNPEFRGTAFARDWTELFWVIDETFRDPHHFLELFKINNLYRHWQAIP